MDVYKETINSLEQIDKFIEQGEMDQAKYGLHIIESKIMPIENKKENKDWIEIVLDAIQERKDILQKI